MEATEILEILGMVNEMENISKVEITLGDTPSLVIEKTPQVLESSNLGTLEPPQEAPAEAYPSFGSAGAYAPEANSNLATEGQRKYADDLAQKLGEGDMMNLVYGLAQALGEVADDILHPSLWKTQLSRAQADAYIDILEEQWKKQKRNKGGF